MPEIAILNENCGGFCIVTWYFVVIFVAIECRGTHDTRPSRLCHQLIMTKFPC